VEWRVLPAAIPAVGEGVALEPVVGVTCGLAVALVGEAALAVGLDVVDLAVLGGDPAAGVLAAAVAQEDGFAEGPMKKRVRSPRSVMRRERPA
jgi:hypothetical protein